MASSCVCGVMMLIQPCKVKRFGSLTKKEKMFIMFFLQLSDYNLREFVSFFLQINHFNLKKYPSFFSHRFVTLISEILSFFPLNITLLPWLSNIFSFSESRISDINFTLHHICIIGLIQDFSFFGARGSTNKSGEKNKQAASLQYI